jgi:hypothetical protein
MSDQGKEVLDGDKKEDWMNAKWRPMMGWMYMCVCTFDFVIFPILWSIVQVIGGGEVKTQWSPVTLQGAGLFHMAMGAVIGVAAFGRTQEKLAGATAATTTVSTPSFGTPAPTPAFGSTPAPTPAPAFGSTPAPAFGSAPAVNASGKKIVPQSDQPEL